VVDEEVGGANERVEGEQVEEVEERRWRCEGEGKRRGGGGEEVEVRRRG
jgi:hypothetical protein